MAIDNSPSPSHLEKLGYTLYKGSVPFDELKFPDEPVDPDFEWASTDPEVQKEYSGKVVAVYDRKVWGVGKSYKAALEDARSKEGYPQGKLVMVVIV